MEAHIQNRGRQYLLRSLLAIVAGALVTLSLAPFNLWPMGILSCTLYCLILNRSSTRQALLYGWLYGLGLFGSGVSWVYVSIHTYGYAPIPLALLLTALFCAGLALLHLLFAGFYVRCIRNLPAGTLVGFPLCWLFFEWLRSWLLTGFPWLFLGYAHNDTWLAGWAPVFGVYGISFICALCGSCLLILWQIRRPSGISFCVVLIAFLWGGGALLRNIEWVQSLHAQTLSVALYQPNISQQIKWERRYLPTILNQYQQAAAELDNSDIVIWPESAIPRFYQDIPDWFAAVAERARQQQSTLISGVPYRSEGNYYNSIIALGSASGIYHKQRLVPFGEYVPLEQWLRGVITFFDLPMSQFSVGPKNQHNLLAQGYRLAPYICYEVVYPELVAKAARNADILLTISNDAWFGHSIGPLQHLQMARMRALENGRYMLRGTNNGISAIINHRGQILGRSEQFIETTLRGEVRIMQGFTPFTQTGATSPLIICVLGLFLMAGQYSRLQKKGKDSAHPSEQHKSKH